MRLTLIGTALAALTTATLLAGPANADRFCRKSVTTASAAVAASTEATDSTCTTATAIIATGATITAGLALSSTDRALASRWTAKNVKRFKCQPRTKSRDAFQRAVRPRAARCCCIGSSLRALRFQPVGSREQNNTGPPSTACVGISVPDA